MWGSLLLLNPAALAQEEARLSRHSMHTPNRGGLEISGPCQHRCVSEEVPDVAGSFGCDFGLLSSCSSPPRGGSGNQRPALVGERGAVELWELGPEVPRSI